MSPATERRLLQGAICLACLVPLLAGGSGMLRSAAILKGMHQPLPTDLDSHFRYLSGLLFGLGLVFLWCVPSIERRGAIVRAVGTLAIVGGLARLLGAVEHGLPSPAHRAALVMELIVVPFVLLWQARVARRFAAAAGDGYPRTS
jgi:hypothetical protein